MAPIKNVGKCFGTAQEFQKYLEGVKFNLWRPRFVTVHHTGAPDLKTWEGWQIRKKPPPVSDEQWMKNLAAYYGNEMGWSAGPHFFITPAHICVLSPPNAKGVHAVSFNSVSWGVETVGDFDREPFEGAVRDLLCDALAVMHVAAGLQPAPFELGVRGLHFHRDDPKTSKTCPGTHVNKRELIAAVQNRIADMTPGDHPSDEPVVMPDVPAETRITTEPDLNVRAAASGKAPVLSVLKAKGSKVSVIGQAMNGDTQWLQISMAGDQSGWIAGRFTREA